MIAIFQQSYRRAKLRVKRYRDNHDGATAVEFAIISLPFFTILFGIIELAVVFFISSPMTHATSEAGRLIRVGRFQDCGKADEFKALICSKMGGIGNCWNNLRVDVITDAEFKTLSIAPAPEPAKKSDEEDEDGGSTSTDPQPVENGDYDDTNGGENVVIRAVYNYRLALPEGMTRLGNPKGSGVRQMTALTAFRNEPFDSPEACDASIQDQIDESTPVDDDDENNTANQANG